MRELAGEAKISKEVIDAWYEVLNDDEQYRSPESPRRYFFTTDITTEWNITDPDFGHEEKYNIYLERMECCTNRDEHILSMRDIDLVIFPVVEPMFYYLVVFNLKSPSVTIIDSELKIEKVK